VIQLKDVEVEEHSVLIAKGVENGMVAFALSLMLKEIKKDVISVRRWCLVWLYRSLL
jgi:hypothetical protein